MALGEIAVEQNGRNCVASQGDIVVFDAALPAAVTARRPVPHDLVTLTVPKERYADIQFPDDALANLTRSNTANPIFACLGLIADHSLSSPACPKEKLAALYHACVSLLPLAAGCYDEEDDEDKSIPGHGHYLLPKILKYLTRNISDPELSPRRVAEHFGVSVRYLHRIFAATGSTFRSHVVAKRLQHVREEIVAAPARTQGIAALARKWGFEDITTFNKAFRRQFGCAPSHFRRGNIQTP